MVASNFSWLAVVLSFLLAAILELLVLPDVVSSLRPEWMVLCLLYWLLRHPEKVGIATAVAVGLVLDCLAGSYFGLHMLATSIVSYLVLAMQQRLKMFPMAQQSLIVFFITGIHLMVVYTVRAVMSVSDGGLEYLWQALTSALIWPLVMVFYDRLVFALR
ncbi:MAG: rod shape-determining protein MreD [Oleiphilaceae bacterium]|nr:rod shape-determining protein MreD [Oleiphilaceae bacterium]